MQKFLQRHYIYITGALFSVATAVILRLIAVYAGILILCVGIKFADRELHFTEDRAGIVVVAGFAVLFGQTEMAGREHKLDTAFHTDHREHADGNVDVISTYAVNKAAVKARADELGNCIDAHAAITERARTLYELAVETDGLSHFDHNGGESGFAVTAKILFIKTEAVVFGIGREYRNVLFAAVKNDFFIERAKSLDLLYSAAADAGFERYTEIVTHRNLIEAFVKGYGLDIDISVYYFHAFTPYCACLVDDFLRHIAKMHTYVLETVFITGRIKNFVHAYAAELFLLAAKPAKRAISFNH